MRKLECFTQAFALNTLAWNNKLRPCRLILLVSSDKVMINRDIWGYLYSAVRGEILGVAEDKRLRQQLPALSFLIKNEGYRIEDDQIPS